ncbi:MAG: ABC transporter permease [Bryobacterales bacterium]|nr:ABC transporter permease [Bryobacterales bacterium]MBV9396839.1 ABC transporter permease [Bryobacterales bacterium]
MRHAARGLRRNSVFTATALLTLAIGIGANTAVFSVVHSILIKPLPYPGADRLAGVWNIAPGAPGLASVSGDLRLSPSMYFTFAEQTQVFQSLGVWTPGTATVTGLAEPERSTAAYVSDGLLQTLETPPFLGRWLTAEDQAPKAPDRAMLGYGFWQRHFGADRSIAGRILNVNSRSMEIAGVMPPGFKILDFTPDLILPVKFDRSTLSLANFSYQGMARLKPGMTVAEANADIARLLPVWEHSWPSTALSRYYVENWRIAPAVRPLKRDVIGNIGDVLWVVMGTIGLVLLIACANVANLLLVRGEARRHELAIRVALGAGWRRVVRELLFESLILGLIGGAIGLVLAYGALILLVAYGPANLPRLNEVSLDSTALVFSFAISAASGLFFGLIPAFKYAGPRISMVLGSSRTGGPSRTRRRAQDALVVAQVALALVLLICAGLMLRTFASLKTVAPGFTQAEQIQSARIALPAALAANPDATAQVHRQILDKLSGIPGASSVAFSGNLPMEGRDEDWDEMFAEGKTYSSGQNPVRLFKFVSPGFFGTMGTKLIAGRDYNWTDVQEVRPVVIISDNYAREVWGSAAAAIGRRIRTGEGTPWREIIGVVEDVRNNGLQENPPAIVYWPPRIDKLYPSSGSTALRSLTLVLRSNRTGTAPFTSEIRQSIWSINSNLPVSAMRSMQEIYDQSLARTSFTLVMLALAGAMALLLGVVGIYGVIAYAVSQRRREIGIRVALGARQRELTAMFVRDGVVLTIIGIAIGLLSSAALTRLMKAVLFGISPIDPATYAAVPTVLLLAAVVASYIPATRAARVNPVDALKAE